jgi:flap endonuclease-1
MGIRYLNKFLKENAKKSIKIAHLSELSGKKIAIDISIYIYKFVADGTLIENIYLMLTILRYYNIIPIFIFDGKAPPEKKELLQKRRKDKKEAQEEYNKLKTHLDSSMNDLDDSEKQELVHNMDALKRNFISISNNDIENVKLLIKGYGASYYDAPGEADEMCALLTIKNKVWACLSEDMDMFVYGCSRVIRYLSLLNHTAVLYDLKGILEELDITQTQLREICVLSGTDYNVNDDNKKTNIYTILKYFNKYKKENTSVDFYEWLHENTEFRQDIVLFNKIYDLFDLNNNKINRTEFEKISIYNGPIEKSIIREILKTDGFIFPVK